jgi:hypothetical protein
MRVTGWLCGCGVCLPASRGAFEAWRALPFN